MRRIALLAAMSLSLAACGGGGGSPPDAPVVTGACGGAGTINTFPGAYTGTTAGAGADFTVPMGQCTDERGYDGEIGEDQVVDVTGMTPDATYVFELETSEDLSFYAATACDADGPMVGTCLLHVDRTLANEEGELMAPGDGRVSVIIDSANDPGPPATGAFTLHVREAECIDNTGCTDPLAPVCATFQCVECASSFDCTAAATPFCDATDHCVAGPAQCTGDDAGEPDDGPAAARSIATPTAATPTIVNAAVCSLPAEEDDWSSLTLAADRSIRFALDWTDAGADLDVRVVDATGVEVASGIETGATPEAFVADLAAGTYLIQVDQYDPPDTAAATPYTLTVSIPECASSFDCAGPARPVCDTGVCVAGPGDCTGDDPADSGTTDDGPAVARDLTGAVGAPVTLTGSACDTPDTEADWYKVTVAQGQGLSIDTSFAGLLDFNLAAFDSNGTLVGLTFWLQPEHITLTYLPAGVYYLRVNRFTNMGTTTAAAYSITSTRTAAQVCASATDCAAEYGTQVYRGSCAAGACNFIAPGTRADGARCDSFDDCLSGNCSYILFEDDAQNSICTEICTTTMDCMTIGTGLTCTTGFADNICIPACATDLDCGANYQSPTIETGEAWDYFVCTPATGVCSPT